MIVQSKSDVSEKPKQNLADIEVRIKHNTRDNYSKLFETSEESVHDILPSGYVINIGPPEENVGEVTPVSVFTIMSRDDEDKYGQTTRNRLKEAKNQPSKAK